MADTSFQHAQDYKEIVPRRDRRTLTDVLRNRNLSANSVIHSDEWRGYYNLPQVVPASIQHSIVNHTYNFVDSATAAHTQVSNMFLLYVILLLLPSWLITALDID